MEVPRGTYLAGEAVVAEEACESTLPRKSGMCSAIWVHGKGWRVRPAGRRLSLASEW